MVEVGKIRDRTLVLNGGYISIFRGGKLVWKKKYMAYLLPDGNSYIYRRRVRITELSGKTLTDYQIKIEIGAGDPIFAHARSAGEDIRFCYYPEENMIPYWIEKFDPVAEEAIIWVKVPEIPANSEIEIYMYYGNPTVASASDVVATFIRVIDGLVGCWHLDEGSGTIAHDSSGNNYDLNLVNNPAWTKGKFNYALDFDGVDDYLRRAEQIFKSFPLTWSLWIKSDVEFTSARALINQGGDPGAGGVSPNFYVRDTADIRFYTYSTAVEVEAISSITLSAGVWYHIVIVVDANGNPSLYINGEYDTNASYKSGSFGQNQPNFYVGANSAYNTAYFDGIIDEVLTFNKALSAEEISDLYNNYGYTTTNYPGKVLVRKYTEPEPSVSVGAEE